MKWFSIFYDSLLCRLSRLFPGRIDYIGGADVLPAPLSREEEEKLVQELKHNSSAVRNKLIEHNLRLVAFIARKFENTNVGIEDLISIGTIGLIKAVNTFDPSKKIKLATYASRCIENEILMFLRRNSKTRQDVSLDEPLSTDWDGNELLLSDVLGSDDDDVYRVIEEDVDQGAAARCAQKAFRARTADHVPALWPFRRRMPHAKRSGRRAGHFAKLHLPPGKKNPAPAAP